MIDPFFDKRYYYFWFFGHVVKLPYEWEKNPLMQPPARLDEERI